VDGLGRTTAQPIAKGLSSIASEGAHVRPTEGRLAMTNLVTEEETAERDVTRALGLASHATRALHATAAHMIACMRSADLTDGEIIVAVRALLGDAKRVRAVTYRAVLATLDKTQIRLPE
jgi:hypothetical protein